MTSAVEPVGLYGSRTTFTGFFRASRERVIPAAIRSQAMSATVLYAKLRDVGAALADEMVAQPRRGRCVSASRTDAAGASRPRPENRLDRRYAVSSYTTCDRRTAPVCARVRSTDSPMIPEFLVSVAPISAGVSSSVESSSNSAVRSFVGQLDAVARDAGEADLQTVPFRANGVHVDRLAWRLGRRDHRRGREVEGDAEHVRVLDGRIGPVR